MPSFPQIYVVRHGQTAWSLSGRHTGRTDIPLTLVGEDEARRVRDRLAGKPFAAVFTSPSSRARKTCELAGYGDDAQIDPDLPEWNYGDYEGLLRPEILAKNPTWDIFRDGVPNGESITNVAARADRIVQRVRAVNGDVLMFSSSHFIRVMTARWLGLEPAAGRFFMIGTASVNIWSYEHSLQEPTIALWNDRSKG